MFNFPLSRHALHPPTLQKNPDIYTVWTHREPPLSGDGRGGENYYFARSIVSLNERRALHTCSRPNLKPSLAPNPRRVAANFFATRIYIYMHAAALRNGREESSGGGNGCERSICRQARASMKMRAACFSRLVNFESQSRYICVCACV